MCAAHFTVRYLLQLFFESSVAGRKGTVHGNLTAKRGYKITAPTKVIQEYFELRFDAGKELNYEII